VHYSDGLSEHDWVLDWDCFGEVDDGAYRSDPKERRYMVRGAGVRSTPGYGKGREPGNAGRAIRSGDRSPIRGGEKGSAATGTKSQSSNTPKTANPKQLTTPKAVTFGQYGKGASGKKRRP
jgi:hypothetical protein